MPKEVEKAGWILIPISQEICKSDQFLAKKFPTRKGCICSLSINQYITTCTLSETYYNSLNKLQSDRDSQNLNVE